MFSKHFASKNQLPGFCVNGTLVENGLKLALCVNGNPKVFDGKDLTLKSISRFLMRGFLSNHGIIIFNEKQF